MRDCLTVGQVADIYGINPQILTTAFHCRKLDRERCPVVGKKRRIPVGYLPEITKVLIELGHVLEAPASC